MTTGDDVPLGNILVSALTYHSTGNYNDTAPLGLNGTERCLFTASPVPDETDQFLVGDPDFRSAYTFFDLGERTVSIAQESYNADESISMPVDLGNASSTYPTGTGYDEGLPEFTYNAIDGLREADRIWQCWRS